ncbi:MAG: hypothetical protein IT371_25555 [Deltaproteobacteria bacterium]|nr:hypothetical protein [Deltaproteobacteria bacterium]
MRDGREEFGVRSGRKRGWGWSRSAACVGALALLGTLLGSARGAWAQEPSPKGDPPPPASQPSGSTVEVLLRQFKARLDAQEARLKTQEALLKAQAARLSEQKEQLQLQEAKLEAQAEGGEDSAKESIFRFYGFMDMGLQRWFLPSGNVIQASVPTQGTTFVLGNINLYVDVQPFDSWRALLEVRLTNYPHGAELRIGDPFGGKYTRTSTSIADVNSASGGWGRITWSAFVLERAYIEYTARDWLILRTGYFFTPYGIWNVDHGTPTLISLKLPEFINSEMLPTRQLGVEALGTFHLGHWRLGYHAYVSNGRTPARLDFTDDKALGGRLFLETSRPARLKFGVSYYWGRYSDETRALTSLTPYKVDRTEVVAFQEHVAGADLAVDAGALRIRAEGVVRTVRFDQGKHEPAVFGVGTFQPSRVEWNTYALVAYRLPWWGLEPYLYFELYRNPTPISEAAVAISPGLNIHFNPHVQLKLQYAHGWFFDFPGYDPGVARPTGPNAHYIFTRLVLAF